MLGEIRISPQGSLILYSICSCRFIGILIICTRRGNTSGKNRVVFTLRWLRPGPSVRRKCVLIVKGNVRQCRNDVIRCSIKRPAPEVRLRYGRAVYGALRVIASRVASLRSRICLVQAYLLLPGAWIALQGLPHWWIFHILIYGPMLENFKVVELHKNQWYINVYDILGDIKIRIPRRWR